MSDHHLLEIKNLHKNYGPVKAVNGLDLQIKEGSCFGLLGPNGAGKTTTLELIEGLKKPSSGEILFRGKTRDQSFFERIGIQFQSTALQDFMTVQEALDTFASFYKTSVDITGLIDLCQLGDFLDREHRKLSGGQRQRLLLAIALVNNPDLLFLDEPTTGLDPQSRSHFWQLITDIKKQGKTVVITTHYMEEAHHLCDEIVIIDKGKVITEGPPETLLKKHFNAKKVFLPLDQKQYLPSDFPWQVYEGPKKLWFLAENVEQMLSYMSSRQLNLSNLEIQSQSLEDLFIQLTGSQLREA